MIVRDLPYESGTDTCMTTGTGQWRQSGGSGDQRVDLIYTADEGIANVCKSGHYGGPELVGRSKPYSPYWVLGDPDSGTGLGLTRTRQSGPEAAHETRTDEARNPRRIWSEDGKSLSGQWDERLSDNEVYRALSDNSVIVSRIAD